MIRITVTPPNKDSFVFETEILSEAQDFLMLLREQGYKAAQRHVDTVYWNSAVTEVHSPNCPSLSWSDNGGWSVPEYGVCNCGHAKQDEPEQVDD